MKYVIANLKMNLVTAKECDEYLSVLQKSWKSEYQSESVRLVVCPPMFFVERFSKSLPQGVFLGSQNVFWETRGSFTGEVSALTLRQSGVETVLCGHSERRLYFGETNEQISKKIGTVLGNYMTALICVGETKEERENEETGVVIAEQIASAMSIVSEDQLDSIIIAYEPRWAIGTDAVPSTADIMQVRIMIRRMLLQKYGEAFGHKVPILYGGSVKDSLMDAVCIEADMDGVLVGRESLNPVELMKIFDKLFK